MVRLRSSRPLLAVMLAAALILAAGGAAVASNMGFKINYPIVHVEGGAPTGRQWLSVPYLHPYPSWNVFCTSTGLRSIIPATTLTRVNNGVYETATCGSTSGPFNGTMAPVPGQGIQILQPNVTGVATSIIVVGSHNPTQAITLAQNQIFLFGVPYHATAVTTNDLCIQANLSRLPANIPATQITLLRKGANSVPGPFAAAFYETTTCGTTTANKTLVLGDAILIKDPMPATNPPPRSFIPAHF